MSNRFEMTSTSQLTLDDLEQFVKMLKGAGAGGDTRITTKETYGDRPGELNTYSMSATVVPPTKPAHVPGYRGTKPVDLV